jgi:hypothetical protein
LPLTTGVTGVLLEANGGTGSSTGNQMFKNRIINGAMVIDQRNAGASLTATTASLYSVDRWQTVVSVSSKYTVQQNAASVTPPTGFTNYLGITSSAATTVGATDFYIIQQSIEGYNIADLNWGSASAQTVTLSFWVRSSLTGSFGVVLQNGNNNRSYPILYTISSANTWEYKTITIAGDTSGTWGTTNGNGVQIRFGLGVGSTNSGTSGAWTGTSNIYGVTGATNVVGTNGATFYITGVQLEKGSTATSFDYRSYGTELALCQRYYEKTYDQSVVPATNTGVDSNGAFVYRQSGLTNATQLIRSNQTFAVAKRTAPTMTLYSTDGTSGCVRDRANSANTTSQGTQNTGQRQFGLEAQTTAATTGVFFEGHWTASAEL